MEVLYVSDHLLLVHDDDGRRLPQMREVDYSDARLVARAVEWQDRLGTPLVVENFASESTAGRGQVDFFAELWRSAGIRPLFDVSNAIVAELNGGDPAGRWLEAHVPLDTCHISGYRASSVDPHLYVDSHDTPVSDESLALLDAVKDAQGPPRTIVVERDGMLQPDSWRSDLARVRATLSG